MTPASGRRRLPVLRPTVSEVETLFTAFADPIRLRLMNALAPGELCVCDLVELLDLPQPTISRHLMQLREAGLVEARREWKFAYYRLAKPVDLVHGNLLDCVRSCFTGIETLDAERAAAAQRARARAMSPC
jgi:ArsR family transcriptional regulator, arsenate/arsenite/antimonite-responsive transcriptional repressor